MPEPAFLRLHSDDNVAIAKRSVTKGAEIRCGDDSSPPIALDNIDLGHKVAVKSISAGQPIIKFGQSIGFATTDIEPGDWVHGHNVEVGELSLDYAFSTQVPPAPARVEGETFMGFRRADGRAATRNYVGIISTVNCSATTSKYVATEVSRELLSQYPNVDGVIALTHKGGCAMGYGDEEHTQLARTLAGFCKHPNIGAYIVIGLGCETAQPSFLVENHGLVQLNIPGQTSDDVPLVMTIQDTGGVRKTVDRAVDVLAKMLPTANDVKREPIPLSEIMLGTECGGSDGYSGITANPAVGICSDLLVARGATSILAEVPEIYGGEHLLTRRAATPEVGKKLIERIRWWEDYGAKFGAKIDNNPSVGNKLGGLTTIYEKSLGAIAKAGSTAMNGVYKYAETITERGFVVMDSPGFDSVSVTGMVASGANVVVFTTGRGSCFGCKPVPTIKVATNTPMYQRMEEDMDINAGRIIDGGGTVEDVGREIFDKVVAVASGEKTKSEAQGIGDEEFSPWMIGPLF